ncbi:MAG: glycosyltransferase family 2 protein [Candidatus Aenigmatarchaeota archaeon]
MKNFPLVSVVILNYNGLNYLGDVLTDCLDSVLNSNYPNLEIIFVDNGSTDGSADFVAKNYPKIKVIRNRCNLGFSEGFNTGIRASKGKYIALLSNDMAVDQNWLNPVIEIMESDKKVGLAGFKRLVWGTKDLIDGIGGDLYLCGRVKVVGKLEIDKGQYDAIIENLDYIGGAMVIRRDALAKSGLFDPKFFVFFEDIDLCYRVRKHGYKVIYVPQSVIYHKGQATINQLERNKIGYLEYMANRSRIRGAILHFTLPRLLSTFLIDSIWFLLGKSETKKSLLKAYWWNLERISETLKKRFTYGPSPPYRCKFPVISLRFSDLVRRVVEITHVTR